MQEFLIHKDDFPGLVPGDLIELYHPENEEERQVPRFCLLVTKSCIYPDNGLSKSINAGSIYIERSLAETFQLPNYRDAMITLVDKKVIMLDSVVCIIISYFQWKCNNSTLDVRFYVMFTRSTRIFDANSKVSKSKCKMVGGAGYRSRYLSHAKRALYHLSYAPILIEVRIFQVFKFQGILHYRN